MCLLTVVHDQWSTGGDGRAGCRRMALILSGLKTLLETGEPLTG
jgi:hypothetical protein